MYLANSRQSLKTLPPEESSLTPQILVMCPPYACSSLHCPHHSLDHIYCNFLFICLSYPLPCTHIPDLWRQGVYLDLIWCLAHSSVDDCWMSRVHFSPQLMAPVNHWEAKWVLRLFRELLPKQQIITLGKLIVRSGSFISSSSKGSEPLGGLLKISNRSAWKKGHLPAIPPPLPPQTHKTDTPPANCGPGHLTQLLPTST